MNARLDSVLDEARAPSAGGREELARLAEACIAGHGDAPDFTGAERAEPKRRNGEPFEPATEGEVHEFFPRRRPLFVSGADRSRLPARARPAMIRSRPGPVLLAVAALAASAPTPPSAAEPSPEVRDACFAAIRAATGADVAVATATETAATGTTVTFSVPGTATPRMTCHVSPEGAVDSVTATGSGAPP